MQWFASTFKAATAKWPRGLFLLGILLAGSYCPRAERLPVKIYTSADGLGTSAIFSLVRDTRGFIWICSRDGLIRFDGYRFITYRIGDDSADPAVYSLAATRKGVYWINLNRGPDYRFVAKDDVAPLEAVREQVAKNDSRVRLKVEAAPFIPPFEDRAGNLWTFTAEGIHQVLEVDGHFTNKLIDVRLPGDPANGFSRVVFHSGRDGSLWFGTNWGLVRRLPDGRQIHFSLNPENQTDPVVTLTEDHNGRLWIARPNGLMVLRVEQLSELAALGEFTSRKLRLRNGANDQPVTFPERGDEALSLTFDNILRKDLDQDSSASALQPVLYGMLTTSDGKMWFTSSRGLILFDGSRFHHFTSQHGVLPNLLASLVEDDDGRIWIGSESGLMRMNPRGLVSFDKLDGIEPARIHSMFEDRNGELHVVSGNWSINRLRNGAFTTARPRLPAGVTVGWQSTAALLDSRGDWWVITPQFVYRYAGLKSFDELSTRDPSATFKIGDTLKGEGYRLFEDSRGDVWMSTWPKGLFKWERSTGELRSFNIEEGIPNALITAFAEDRAGNLWIGSSDGGSVRYKDRRFTPVVAKSGVTPAVVLGFHLDKAGRLWIASPRTGLSRVDDPTAQNPQFRNYTIADGLSSNNVRCITTDNFGNVYIGTVRGINRLTPDSGRIKYFGTGDGLVSDFVTTAYRDRHGALWFGTLNGLSRMIPESELPLPPPPILISGVRIAGVDYSVSPLGQRDVFVADQNADRNNLQIDFMSVGYGGDASTRYEYKLEGADSDWSPQTAAATVTFANLSPGRYRFLVRAANAEGALSPQPASLSFRILPPVWQRWWFLTLAALLVGGMVYALYRYRVAQLLKVERVRTRIATDLHDDIGASLSRMAILSEVVKQQTVGGNGQKTAPLLTEIADSARGLVDSMGDIVWSIDPRRDDLQSVVRRIRQFASDVLEAKGIDWELLVPPEVESLKLSPEQRQHLFLIFKEGINNVARHGEGTKSVSLSIKTEGRQLLGEIRDDGCGFTPQEPAESRSRGLGGNGLPNMRERAAQLRGRLEIASSPGGGTRVTLAMPLN